MHYRYALKKQYNNDATQDIHTVYSILHVLQTWLKVHVKLQVWLYRRKVWAVCKACCFVREPRALVRAEAKPLRCLGVKGADK